jgi:hypothetical protein
MKERGSPSPAPLDHCAMGAWDYEPSTAPHTIVVLQNYFTNHELSFSRDCKSIAVKAILVMMLGVGVITVI